MGLGSEPLWEVQWHGSGPGPVRRFFVTRKTRRWLLAILAMLGLVFMAAFAAMPIGLQLHFQRFTLKALRQENRSLRQARQDLVEEARNVGAEVATRLNRGVRFAWVMGEKMLPAPSEFPGEPNEEELVSWLDGESEKLLALANALVVAPGPPCPLNALPTAWPLEIQQAVPLGLFGFRVSPFTGQEEPHWGLTLAAPLDSKVLAAGDGRVAFVGSVHERATNRWSKLGTVVLLDHGGGTWSLYGHLGTVKVRPQQLVQRGQSIATVGASGWTRVSALYFEVRWPFGSFSLPVDPLLLQLNLPLRDLQARLADPTAGLGSSAPPLATLLGWRGKRS